ncbi:MAG TPA: hydantoinase B/oxoprolinase family protein [Chloroflexota bacterium]|nr:hydantoinase B/oxoprolinase family protein [Chloroflexota bacterium]
MAIDPITLELVKNSVESVVDEMALTIMRTAYSSNLKSSNDLSSAFCSLDGELLAQGFTLPMQLGSIPDAMEAVLAKFGGRFEPGDCVILNDPYEGGTHLPDIFLIKPLFLDGEHVAYCATIAHHTDVGGRVAGGNASDSTEIYQEGLRLPPLKLYAAGRPNEAVFDIISRNVRVPDNLLGDLRAQLAAIHIGERGLEQLAARWGGRELFAALDELMAYTERLARAEIAAWPDGAYHFVDYIDDDGLDPDPIPIRVTVSVRGDSLEVDFAGTAAQVRGAINATGSFARSAVYACVRGLMDPGIPNNGGYFRPIKVVVPEGTVINPHLPAPVAARGLTGFRLANAIFGALAQAAPQRVPACESGGDTGITIGGYDDQRRAFVFLEFLHGSWGGRPNKDGIDACSSAVANFSNNPIEQLEAEYPLRIEQYAFVPDSGGAGKYRGGLAMVREYRFLEREGALQLRTDRHRYRPWGLEGGRPGAPSSNLLIRDGAATPLPSKGYLTLKRDDVLRHFLAGAGGHGDPLERDPGRVAADVADEKVSPEQARSEYGVVLDPRTGQPELVATEELRKFLRTERHSGRSNP